MVYVLNKNGQPLMPTENYRMARMLLKEKKAKVVRRTPFTIKLIVKTKEFTQPIVLGVDAGSKTIGFSASTELQELYSAELKPRNDVVNNLSTRREFRRASMLLRLLNGTLKDGAGYRSLKLLERSSNYLII